MAYDLTPLEAAAHLQQMVELLNGLVALRRVNTAAVKDHRELAKLVAELNTFVKAEVARGQTPVQ